MIIGFADVNILLFAVTRRIRTACRNKLQFICTNVGAYFRYKRGLLDRWYGHTRNLSGTHVGVVSLAAAALSPVKVYIAQDSLEM